MLESPDAGAALVALRVQYLGLVVVPPLFYLFSREYYAHGIRNPGFVVLLFVVPAVQTVLVNTWPAQHWYFDTIRFSPSASHSPIPVLEVHYGPFAYAALAYAVLCLAAGLFYIGRQMFLAKGAERAQSAVFLAAALLPVAAGTLWLLQLLPVRFNFVPAALCGATLVVGLQITRFRNAAWRHYARDSVLENLTDAYILLDTAHRFLDANAAAKKYFPALRRLAAGTPISKIDGLPQNFAENAEAGFEFTIGEGETQRYLRTSGTPIRYRKKIICVAIMLYDHTETYKLMQELNELATHDNLTGLYNRGTFFKLAERDFDLALRSGDAAAVLMMDIDHFKTVNDRYGHLCGDRVLAAIADILRARLRRTDIVGRYGGEEICVWLPGATDEGAWLISEVIRRTIEQSPFHCEGEEPFHITISIGIASLNHGQHKDIAGLIAEADAALYRAKEAGRNRVRLA